jgi:hypothetical protein
VQLLQFGLKSTATDWEKQRSAYSRPTTRPGEMVAGAFVTTQPRKRNMSKKMHAFATFDEAFDFCREANHPVKVIVNGEIWKLYPSGIAVQ